MAKFPVPAPSVEGAERADRFELASDVFGKVLTSRSGCSQVVSEVNLFGLVEQCQRVGASQ